MAEVILGKNNFEKEVLKANGPVLVDFWASWCGPCKMLGPVIHEIAEEYEGKVKVCKVNVEDEMELAREYRIASIPTLMLFEKGVPVKQSIGYLPKEEIVKMWE